MIFNMLLPPMSYTIREITGCVQTTCIIRSFTNLVDSFGNMLSLVSFNLFPCSFLGPLSMWLTIDFFWGCKVLRKMINLQFPLAVMPVSSKISNNLFLEKKMIPCELRKRWKRRVLKRITRRTVESRKNWYQHSRAATTHNSHRQMSTKNTI